MKFSRSSASYLPQYLKTFDENQDVCNSENGYPLSHARSFFLHASISASERSFDVDDDHDPVGMLDA